MKKWSIFSKGKTVHPALPCPAGRKRRRAVELMRAYRALGARLQNGTDALREISGHRFRSSDGCAVVVEGEYQPSRSGDVESRTIKLVASGPGLGTSSLQSSETSILPASIPFAAWSWWTVVRGGSALTAAGMSSKPTTETSSGTESPRSFAHAMTPSASWSLEARTAVGPCSGESNACAALRPNSLELPGHP